VLVRPDGRPIPPIAGAADILIDNQTAPSTPAAGKSIIWVDATTKKTVQTDDAGARHGAPLSKNFSTASQGAGFAADTYITNSGILIPSFGMEAGQYYRWFVHFSKTAAGTATPILQFRIGSAQTTADTSRLTLTGQAATAAVSGGIIEIGCLVRSVSATGVIAGSFGFASGILGPGGGIDGVSATFDNTGLQGQFLGLSLNAGASAAWTVTAVYGELVS
jgi:hypothetical protein